MKTNINTLLLLQQTLEKISTATLPVKFQVVIRHDLKKIMEETEAFNEVRNNLIQKYGTTDDFGNCEIKEDSEEFQSFITELAPVLVEEVDVISFRYFNVEEEEFLDILSQNNENILLTGLDLELLQILMKENIED